MIRVRRVYAPPEADDGLRFLVERLWPRGVAKAALRLDGWLPDVAPSTALRRWFGHDPARWEAFQERYWSELEARPDAWRPLLEAARGGGHVTLLYSARDTAHNSAVVLRRYLEHRLARE